MKDYKAWTIQTKVDKSDKNSAEDFERATTKRRGDIAKAVVVLPRQYGLADSFYRWNGPWIAAELSPWPKPIG